jgi:hypothetical protein
MFNKEVALNTQAWEEITDSQGETITGGAAPTLADIEAQIAKIYNTVSGTPNFDPVKTQEIFETVLSNNGAIKKFF